VRSVTTAPSGLRGRGVPGPARLRRGGPGGLDPFIHMDQMGEVEYAPGEPKGTAVAPAPRLRDRHLHHRRHLRARGQPRWRRHVIRRRHPVDDGRLRAAAHRGPAGGARVSGGLFHGIQLWVNLPAHDEDDRTRATRTSAAARSACSPAHDGGPLLRVIAGEVDGHQGPGITHTPISDRARHHRAGASSSCRGTPGSTRSSTSSRARAVGPERRYRFRRASSPSSVPGDLIEVGRPSSRRAAAPSLEVYISGGSPSASRSPPTARSS
jgi:hypothetical protein